MFPKIENWRLQKTPGNHGNQHYFTWSICLVINKLKYLYLKTILDIRVMFEQWKWCQVSWAVDSVFSVCTLSLFIFHVRPVFLCSPLSVCIQSASRLMSCSSCLHNKHPQPACESCVWVHSATLFNWNMETTGVTKQIQCIAVSVMTTLAPPGVIRVKLFIINELWSAPKGNTLPVHEFLQCVCVRVPG